MFEAVKSVGFEKEDGTELIRVTFVGLIKPDDMAAALQQFTATGSLLATSAPAPASEGNGRRRRGSSEAVTDAAASTSTEPTATTAADAAPATGRRRRGAATDAPAATDAAPAATEAPAGGRRRRTAAAPEPETPKIDTSNPGITVAATTAVKMIGNPADVVVLVKDFLDANGKPCENVSDIVQGEREEFLQELNRLVIEKTAKPLPGIG